jgi:hypothetical protein
MQVKQGALKNPKTNLLAHPRDWYNLCPLLTRESPFKLHLYTITCTFTRIMFWEHFLFWLAIVLRPCSCSWLCMAAPLLHLPSVPPHPTSPCLPLAPFIAYPPASTFPLAVKVTAVLLGRNGTKRKNTLSIAYKKGSLLEIVLTV